MPKTKIAVIYGGANSEHEVSIVSARSIIKHLDKTKYAVTPIYITKQGQWRVGESTLLESGLSIKKLQANSKQVTTTTSPTSLVPTAIKDSHVVFPVLHGKLGEDGTIQGMLEMLGIPYVGSKVLGSAICMDKDIQKQLARTNQIPIVPYMAITHHSHQSQPHRWLQLVESRFNYPLFIKPANAGSSVGVSKVSNRQELERGIALAFEHDQKILVEQAVAKAREIECAVLGNDEPEASVLGEVIPDNDFYDYEAKYISDTSTTAIPADLPEDITESIKSLAIKAFQVMQCSGLARVDFLVEQDTNRVYLNELNTMPGFTPISMYPKLWEATDLPYDQLLNRLIKLALEKR